ncbi:MAG TPA: NADH-quinone oxidoreductase subunit H [Bryobacteraceae bacterium]|nr:NADH-quinone oxidoreductase subunit H [Bryobacteraceae bacterium]
MEDRMNVAAFLHIAVAMILAPFLLGVINRTKAIFAGRTGQPLLQVYYDLLKLLRKGAVYSRTTTWVFRAGPIVGLAALLTALLLVPFGAQRAPLAFEGDVILFAGLFAVLRFFTVIAALDTGSAFEGMGASREVQFSALAEPALLLGLAALAPLTGSFSLSGMLAGITAHTWLRTGPALALVVAVLLVVFLTENARIPVDDPNTHLELTMIHEVMVLDHSGPDLAFILYGSALKLWTLGVLLVGILLPVQTGPWLDVVLRLAGMIVLAVVTGIIESTMARLRLTHVPQFLAGAGVLSVLALLLALR